MEKLNLLKNKRADISILILVIGVFIVCTLALLNFYFEGVKDRGFFEGVELVKQISDLQEDINFYNSLDKESLDLIGLSEGFENGDFKFKGTFDSQTDKYTLMGEFNETSWFGFVEGESLVYVEHKFPK